MVDNNVPVTTVWASRGKVARAEPVSALYEQGPGSRRLDHRATVVALGHDAVGPMRPVCGNRDLVQQYAFGSTRLNGSIAPMD